jgi:uncharacterized protein with HEPN domain
MSFFFLDILSDQDGNDACALAQIPCLANDATNGARRSPVRASGRSAWQSIGKHARDTEARSMTRAAGGLPIARGSNRPFRLSLERPRTPEPSRPTGPCVIASPTADDETPARHRRADRRRSLSQKRSPDESRSTPPRCHEGRVHAAPCRQRARATQARRPTPGPVRVVSPRRAKTRQRRGPLRRACARCGDLRLFHGPRLLQRAFVRSLEVIGEAAKHVSEPFRTRYPDIPWRAMIGMRDRMIHHYLGVDYEIVWDVAKNKAPALRVDLERLVGLESLPGSPGA